MAKQNQTTGRPGPARRSTTQVAAAAAPAAEGVNPALSATLEVIDFCRRLNVTAELVGRWVWVSFPDTPEEATRKALKEFGFQWSPRRGKWAHNCGVPTKSAHQSDPWAKYGSRVVHQPKAAV